MLSTENRFSFERLVELIKARSEVAGVPVEQRSCFVQACLTRLLHANIDSSEQLAEALRQVPVFVEAEPCTSLLVIDSIAAFYWLDRAAGGELPAEQDAPQASIAHAMANLLTAVHPLAVVVTKPAYFGQGTESSLLPHKEYLSKAWRALVTKRFITAPVQRHDRQFLLKQILPAAPNTKNYRITARGIVF